jgi:hypothetical protein
MNNGPSVSTVKRTVRLAGRIAKGVVIVNRQMMAALVQDWPDGDVDIAISTQIAKRTNEQNRAQWGVALKIIGEELGYDKDELRDLSHALMIECYGSHEEKTFGLVVPNKTSSQLTKAEWSDFWDWLVRFAAKKWGIVIPDPNPDYRRAS